MKQRWFSTLARFTLVILFCITVLAPVRAAGPEVPALVQIGAASPAAFEQLAGMQIYTRLYTAGGEFLIAPALSGQIGALRRDGFTVTVLDAGSPGAAYYLLTAMRPGALDNLGEHAALLLVEGRQAVARLDPAADEAAMAHSGVELLRLEPQRLVEQVQTRPLAPQVILPSPTVQSLINQVQLNEVQTYDGNLSGEWPVEIGGAPYTIDTRYSRTVIPIQKATQYAYEQFQSFGLDVVYHDYNLTGTGTRRNVIAEQPGVAQPERIFLITAHLDSTSGNPYIDAPGADDNASGSVAVLLAAKIFSQFSFDCTLRYALFTGEEQGLIGSEAYAADVSSTTDIIEGVLNLDMIAYNSDAAPIVELHTRPGDPDDAAIATLFADVVNAYDIDLAPQVVADGIQASDHAAFWNYDIPAILAIEDFEDFTPYYHTVNDRLNSLDMTYFTNFVKASLGTFAHMGCIRMDTGTLAGQVTAAETGSPLSGASVAVTAGTFDWGAITNASGNYTVTLTPGIVDVTVSAPGYISASFPSVQVAESGITPLDAALQTCHALTNPTFSVLPPAPQAASPVSFSGSAAGSGPVSYHWNFGDGASGSGAAPQHTYAIAGDYTVTLTANNCAGFVTLSQVVHVSGTPAIHLPAGGISASANPLGAAAPTLWITNTGTSTLEWALAETPEAAWLQTTPISGSIPALQSQAVLLEMTAPASTGLYTTTLQVASNDPLHPLSQVEIGLEVTPACVSVSGADMLISPATAWMGQEITFTAVISEGSQPVQYTWLFGDGSQAVAGASQVVHIFPVSTAAHTYPVTLTVANACTLNNQVQKQITLLPWMVYLPSLAGAAP